MSIQQLQGQHWLVEGKRGKQGCVWTTVLWLAPYQLELYK